jgi:ankyrin repeat protein
VLLLPHFTGQLIQNIKRKDVEGLRQAMDVPGAEEVLEAAGPSGLTPLNCAVRAGWLPGVELLLDHGASALSRTPALDMALHWAAYRGDADVLQQLINAGGDVNSMGDVGNRPIHLAASADRLEVRQQAHACMQAGRQAGVVI